MHEGHLLSAGGSDEACEVINPLERPGFRRNFTIDARLMKTGAILQRSVMARQRQHGDEVELGIVLGDILQHLHHGRRGDQVVARQARAVGDDSVAEIDPSLLTQDLPYGIGARPPGARYAKPGVADGAKDGVGNHVV